MTGTVWVVDDNDAVSESLTTLLQVEGIPARSVHGTDVALELLTSGQIPSAMILDLSMPRNGNNVLDTICKNQDWTFPILILTGWDELLKNETARRAYAVLSKTIAPAELVAILRGALGVVK